MKKSILIGLVVTISISLGFARSVKYSGSPGYVTAVQSDKQQKKELTSKVVYTCPMHPEVIQDKPGKCPKCGMNLVKKEVIKEVYTCPMHPEVIQDKPGKCPRCGMNLVKKEPAKIVEPKKK